MNIIIDMVTGEMTEDEDIIVISNRYTKEEPEKRENTDFSSYIEPELQIREIEPETSRSIPVDISKHDIDTFLNDMS